MLQAAIEAVLGGGLVVFPTETVYGLGGDATNPRAVRDIFALKSRPKRNPLIIHCANLERARRVAKFSRAALRLAERFWPGPLTMVLPLAEGGGIAAEAVAGLDTVAVRHPAHPLARRLLEGCGVPLAAPSANLSGRLSPTTAANSLRGVAAVLDGGSCPLGLESTIVDLSTPSPLILRPGSLTIDELEPFASGIRTASTTASASAKPIKAPGMLARHYAPLLPLRLNATSFADDEAVLGFGDCPQGGRVRLNLSPLGDLSAAAANLYAMLAELEGSDCRAIAVSPIPQRGVGVAINDRLRRAAANEGANK